MLFPHPAIKTLYYYGGYYWLAFNPDNLNPTFYSSPNGTTWTSQGNIFTSTLTRVRDWALKFKGSKVYAVGNLGDNPYFRMGILQTNGAITWGNQTYDSDFLSRLSPFGIAVNDDDYPWISGRISNSTAAIDIFKSLQLNGEGQWTPYTASNPYYGSDPKVGNLFSLGNNDMYLIFDHYNGILLGNKYSNSTDSITTTT